MRHFSVRSASSASRIALGLVSVLLLFGAVGVFVCTRLLHLWRIFARRKQIAYIGSPIETIQMRTCILIHYESNNATKQMARSAGRRCLLRTQS